MEGWAGALLSPESVLCQSTRPWKPLGIVLVAIRTGMTCSSPEVAGLTWGCRGVLKEPALEDRPQGPPTATNRQPPPTANDHQPPTADRH